MEASRRKLVIDVMETAMAQSGWMDMYRTFTGFQHLIEAMLPMLREARSRQSLDAYLTKVSAAEEENLDRYLPLLAAAPGILGGFLEGAVRATAAGLPGVPAGRPVALTNELRRSIVDFIYGLDRLGVARGAAQARAAQHFGLAKRTVQRAWRERARLPVAPAPTMEDIWRVFGLSSELSARNRRD